MSENVQTAVTGVKTPSIRFRGYIDEWETKKLGDVVDITMGQSPKSENYTDNPNDHILVQGNADMKQGVVCPRVWTTQVTKQAEKGDIILSVRAPVGDVGLTDYNVVLGRGVAGIKGSNFMFQQLVRLNKIGYWIKYSTGSTFESINSSDLKNALLDIPTNTDEQTDIGQFFKTLDDLIQAQDQQVEHYAHYKQAMLQKLFPKKGERLPELRFAGFSGDWEEVKLGDVFKRVSVKGRSDLPFITVSESETNERSDSAQGYGNDISKSAREKAKVILTGQFLIDLSSYERGFYMSRMDGLTSNTYHVLDLKSGDTRYWVEYFTTHNFVQSLKRLTPPGARQGKMIEVKDLMKYVVASPSLDEQQQIGQFFKTLDETIEQHKQKVEAYETMKQAFLQKMFV